MIASEGWPAVPERDLAVAYIFWTAKAQKALDARKYAQAEQLANQSLRLRPDQPKAFQVLAHAQFAEANFSGAAAAYRKILDAEPRFQNYRSYAQALAAADRKSARGDFRHWAEGLKGEKPREAEVSSAGLALLAGNPECSVRSWKSNSRRVATVQAPGWIGELGWWHYLNGDYQRAVDLLSEADAATPRGSESPDPVGLGADRSPAVWRCDADAKWHCLRTGRSTPKGQSCELWQTGRRSNTTKRCGTSTLRWGAAGVGEFELGQGALFAVSRTKHSGDAGRARAKTEAESCPFAITDS